MKHNISTIVASLALACAVLVSLSANAYERVNKPNPDDEMAVSIFKLDNGLTVYLTENHETPRFYAEIAVRAGSKHDPAESTGLAHYLEHLLFKGSTEFGTLDFEKERVHIEKIESLYQEHFNETDPEKRKAIYAKINEASALAAEFAVPNELDRMFKTMGGSMVNAHTWHEETVYKVSLPANRLEQWARLEAERFSSPVFRLFQTELETVYEEMNRALDNKDRIIRYAVNEQLFKKHPYGTQPTIGTVDHLKNPSLQNIGEYFDTWYVPNNMAIFVSGDFDTENAMAIIDANFSQWKPKDLPDPKSWEEPALEGREEIVRTYEGEETVLLAFRTASQGHEDAEALTLIDMILDNASAGLINLNLNQQQRVRQAGSNPMLLNDYGAQYLWGIPKDGQTLEDVEKLLLEQLELVKTGAFGDWLVPAIINDFKKNTKGGLESDPARVSDMRQSWLAFQSWDHHVARFDRMSKLTKDDIVRVANKYFGDDYVAGLRTDAPHEVPDIEKPALAAIDIDPQRESNFGRELLSLQVQPIEPTFVDRDGDLNIVEPMKGIRLYYVKNPLNDLFSFSIDVPVGTRHEKSLNLAASLFNKSGTDDLTPEALQQEWYKLGTSMSFGAGDEDASISIVGLDENFDASMALLHDALHEPKAPPETLDELKKIIMVRRADAQKQAATISRAVVQFNRYGGESDYLERMTGAEIDAATAKQLYDRAQGLLDYEQNISYVGSLPIDTVIDAIKEFYGKRKSVKEAPDVEKRVARAPEQSEIYFFHKEAAQAQIRLEFGSGNYIEGRNPTVQLYNNYFAGGMAGIVFQELREARALAYSAGARYIEGGELDDENIMVGVIGSQADKTVDAVKAFIDLLDNLPESDERFAISRAALISRYRTAKIGFRGVVGAVRAWEDLALAGDPRAARYKAIQASDLSNVLAFHEGVIQNRPKLISVVGDESKIDMAALEEIATIRKVSLEEIFSK
jgi:predicted Zn-dependent peptidase